LSKDENNSLRIERDRLVTELKTNIHEAEMKRIMLDEENNK
jgi:hypothetical protein